MSIFGGITDWLFGGGKTDPKNAKIGEGQWMTDYLKGRLGSVDGRAAPQADRTTVGQVKTGTAAQLGGEHGQFRNRQMDLADQLTGVASGQQMGAGELAVRRQMQQAAAAQQAQAQMARGGLGGIMGRAAARNLGNLGVNAAGASREAALQDQSQARGLLAGVLGQGRGQDIDVASQNAALKQQMNLANLSAENQRIFQQAGLDQATSLANLDARLRTMGMNDQARIAYLSQLFGISHAEMLARLQQEAVNAGDKGIFGDLLQAGASVGAAALMRK